MHLDTCKSCGGSLERIGNYYVCKFCGSKWTIDANQDVHVIDRANAWSALRDCDFERAGELFENIIYKEPENHEAYWGRALANAGIMYVTDFHENRKVPTCNSISESSFIESRDVKKAIELAPADIARSYQSQAEQIESIRVEWVKKASREPAYDVFISYKDSDREHGIDRTDDSYDAHELYNALTAEGYKVFFSRVSLRSKVSEHYEPYIYNAIKTAKVMIVFGEKPEYFNAVWIKNEWMRFRKRIELGEKHPNSLVVAYKGIDPADLPVGLRSRQCLDAGSFTFLEDLKT
ncbi:MAG: TIR domain-containing protein, partial [Clostridia bacterium]|nr:TIR domain-containing protein [Clostridia bacterium]